MPTMYILTVLFTLNHPCHFDPLQVISTPSLSFQPEGEICRSATCNINSQNYTAGFRPRRRGTFAETKGTRRVGTTPH